VRKNFQKKKKKKNSLTAEANVPAGRKKTPQTLTPNRGREEELQGKKEKDSAKNRFLERGRGNPALRGVGEEWRGDLGRGTAGPRSPRQGPHEKIKGG